MIEALLELPTHIRKRLAGGLTSGLLAPPYSLAALRSVLGVNDDTQVVLDTLNGLDAKGVSGAVAAAWVTSMETAATSRNLRPDMVWSGPEVTGLYARDTRRVYEEILGSANRSVWASTYAFFDGPKAFDILARRMDAVSGLRVKLLLNIQRKRGDTTEADQLVRRFADHFWATDWPGSTRPSIFYDPRAIAADGPGGVLHAKAVVVDDETVFVTSANLTEAALDRNIELGLLVRDRAVALTIASHFQVLIDRGLLNPLPAT